MFRPARKTKRTIKKATDPKSLMRLPLPAQQRIIIAYLRSQQELATP
jgi:hypothetical protein